MLFIKIGTGNKYLHKIDSVNCCLHKSDCEDEYWHFIHDEVAYYHDGSGYHTACVNDIVEVDESEVVKVFTHCYKWKEC